MIDLIKSQVLTDKSSKILQNNFYVFEVDKRMSKLKIKLLIEETFAVNVISVNTYILPGKRKRLGKFQGLKNSYKRAYVKVAPGSIIPFFSSL